VPDAKREIDTMTTKWRTERPAADEHAPFYAGYIGEAPGGDVVATLDTQGRDFTGFLRGIPEARGGHRYAPGKWSIKDIVLHCCDAERVFSYRLMRFARADATDLPGFDENTYAAHGAADAQTLAELATHFEAVRRATVALVDPMQDEQMLRRGSANGHAITPRALAWVLPGHVAHHEKVIRERYL
jgi:hypothetical protein